MTTGQAGSAGSRRYGNRVFRIEPFGVERVGGQERHGNPFQLFTLWAGANLSVADFALGFLPIHLGISWTFTIWSLVIGNVLGGILLGLATVMGPTFGLPQLMIGRWSFGRVGEYFPAALTWISTVGWFTVKPLWQWPWGSFLSLLGAGRFETFFEDFLLLLGYWVTPWMAVLLVEFFMFSQSESTVPVGVGRGFLAFLIGILVSVPFMSNTLYTGPIANRLNGADISFYVGFVVAGLVYLLLRQNVRPTTPQGSGTGQ